MKRPILFRQINTGSSYDINHIIHRLENNEPGFAKKLIDIANSPLNFQLRNELRSDIRFKYFWNELINNTSRL